MRDALLGLLILFAVASDKLILGRLQTIWVRARREKQELAEPGDGVTSGA